MTEPTRSYVEKVRRGERPTEQEAIAFLRDWHARHPGATGRVLTSHRLTTGESTYERLAACVPHGAGDAVLDLCCGDGVLVDLVVRRLGEAGSAVGVDASDEDLEGGRARVPDPRARFHAGLAGALPLPSASIDVALCHYALMLLRPLEPAVAELARVLRPGGLFAAILPSRSNLATIAPAFAAFGASLIRASMPAFPDIGLGDPRLATEGPGAFFHEATGFSAPETEPLRMESRMAPAEILDYLELTYPFDLLQPEAQRRHRQEGLPLLQAAAEADGRLPFTQEVALLTVRRAA